MILDFNLVVPAAPTRQMALDERDRVINLLKDNGYNLVMTEDSTRVLMEKQTRHPKREA